MPRSPSPASSFHTPPPDPEESFQRDLRMEREAYDALVNEGGIPLYPIDLILDVFNDNPGQYEDVVSYWDSFSPYGRSHLFKQLRAWRRFRDYQKRVRRYFIERNRFPEYPQRIRDRRQRHGLEGDVELLEEFDKQSKLQNWVEYQDSQYQTLEKLEKKIKEAQAKAEAMRKAADEAGVPGFDGIFDPDNFGEQMALSIQSNDKEAKAVTRRISVEKALQLAEKRLDLAQSEQFGATIRRAAWIKLFLKDVQAAQIRFDEVPMTGYGPEDWHTKEKRHRPPPEEKEECDKWWEIEITRRDASGKRHKEHVDAWVTLEFEKGALKAAQSDGFGDSVDRASCLRHDDPGRD